MTDDTTQAVIIVTERAAQQIQIAARQDGMERLALRIAATRNEDGSIRYAMGFDESSMEDDLIRSAGVTLVIAPKEKALLQGTEIDFVELEPGDFRFIFKNPNDANYSPPTE
ncbi:MAG: HesB/IscA family protein [Gammaproteobacteria bacterium]